MRLADLRLAAAAGRQPDHPISSGMRGSAPPAAAAPGSLPHAGQPHADGRAAFARYFQDVRARIGLPVEEVSRRLGVDPRVIHVLEAGNVPALPPWPEVERVVGHYMGSLGLDPAPALRSIAAAVEHHAAAANAVTVTAPAPVAAAPRAVRVNVATLIAARLAPLIAVARRTVASGLPRPMADWRGLTRKATALAVMVAVAGGAVLAAQSSLVKPGGLPGPAASFMRSASDSVLLLFAPKRDGLRWIEVDDPRSRRGDKLQTARR